MNCQNCQADLPANARVCPKCGTPVPNRASVQVTQKIDTIAPGGTAIGTQINYSQSQREALHDYLARTVAAYETRMYQALVPRTKPPDQPYKFLYAYELEDAGIFFGRDAAGEALHQTVLQDRLTVLHAPSGAGKTSLLRAGLSPRLIGEGRLPVYARAYEEPVQAIKRALAPASLGPWPELLPRLTLQEFLGLACAHLSRQTRELVILLDQFEGFLIFWPERKDRQPFVDALAECYGDSSLPVRFVLGIRTDYFGPLATFQNRLLHIFHNQYYLDAMNRQQAQEAITRPVSRLGHPVAYEPALLDVLLDDLARGGTELPHLQIICTELYKALEEKQPHITLAAYEDLGRAEGILTGYLNSKLKELSGVSSSVAREILAELVSSEATRRVLGYDTLAARIQAERSELDRVLAWLVDARLLHRDEMEGEVRYEMAHEYLIEEIRGWIDREDLAFKQAEELLEREMATWRVHGTSIPRERLEVLYTQREQFRGLDDESWQCILQSALQVDFAVEDWAILAGERGVRPLLEALDEPREAVRRAATRGLGAIWKLPDVYRLADKSERVRREAAKALAQLGDPRAVEPLLAALRDDESSIRQGVAQALGQLGDLRAVEPLIATLQDENGDISQAAARALGQLGDPHAVETLIAALQDERGYVRRYAAEALGQLGDQRAVEPLIVILRDKDDRARQGAVEALGQLGEPALESLIATLRDKDDRARQGAIEALGQLGDPRAVEPLVAALQDGESDMCQVAAWALGQIGDPRAVESLIAVLRDKDDWARQGAVEALGQLGEPALESLIADLRDKDGQVRQRAAWALGQFGDPHAVEPLIAALRDGEGEVRQNAVWALGQLGDERAVKPLVNALRDRESEVRRNAAWALGQLRDARAVEALIAALQDGAWDVREGAGSALMQLGEPSVQPLLTALQDRDHDVRRRAAEVLGQLGDTRAVEPLTTTLRDKHSTVRLMATKALGQLGDTRAVGSLIAVLRDKEGDGDMRQVAARALGQIGDPRAVELLIAAVREGRWDVRRGAAEALKQLGDPRAVEPLIAALQDEDRYVHLIAAQALGQLGDPRAVAPLIAALRDEESDVCQEAARALKIIGTPEALAALEEWGQAGDV